MPWLICDVTLGSYLWRHNMSDTNMREELDRAIPRLKELTAEAVTTGSTMNAILDRDIAMPYFNWINSLSADPADLQKNIVHHAAMLEVMTIEEIALVISALAVHHKTLHLASEVLVEFGRDLVRRGKHAATFA